MKGRPRRPRWLRTKLVADDGREFELDELGEWWLANKTFSSSKALVRWFQTGALTREECHNLWIGLGRADAPPKRAHVYAYRENLQTPLVGRAQ